MLLTHGSLQTHGGVSERWDTVLSVPAVCWAQRGMYCTAVVHSFYKLRTHSMLLRRVPCSILAAGSLMLLMQYVGLA